MYAYCEPHTESYSRMNVGTLEGALSYVVDRRVESLGLRAGPRRMLWAGRLVVTLIRVNMRIKNVHHGGELDAAVIQGRQELR